MRSVGARGGVPAEKSPGAIFAVAPATTRRVLPRMADHKRGRNHTRWRWGLKGLRSRNEQRMARLFHACVHAEKGGFFAEKSHLMAIGMNELARMFATLAALLLTSFYSLQIFSWRGLSMRVERRIQGVSGGETLSW